MACINEEEDRISHLPRDIIQSILEILPLQEAIRTSVLSRNWRYNWISVKNIQFTIPPRYPDSIHDYPKIFHDVMVQHDGSIESFSLSALYSKDFCKFITTGLAIAATKGVKDLALVMSRPPNNLYSFSEITHLRLDRVQFLESPPPSFMGFPNLINLHFEKVDFFNGSFDIFMSGCPLLEVLNMDHCGPYVKDLPVFRICSVSLKHLDVYSSDGPTFHIDAKNLETLLFWPPRCIFGSPVVAPPLKFLKKLTLCTFLSQLEDEALLLFSIIQGASLLRELEIRTSFSLNSENVEQLMKSSEVSKNLMFDQLQFVKMKSYGNTKHELFFLKFILARSPSLQKIVFSTLGFTSRCTSKFHSKLMGFPRASPEAKIFFN